MSGHRIDIEQAVEAAVDGMLSDPDGRDLETERDDLLAVIYCWRDEILTDLHRASHAYAAYFAMWQFFLRLPSPTPLSDAVQREAMRLRALIPTEPGGDQMTDTTRPHAAATSVAGGTA